MSIRLLIINPGSTSTKISVFDDRKELFTQSVFHDAPQLLQFPSVNDQVDFRLEHTEEILKEHNISMDSIDVIVGRGGSAYPQKSGVIEIDEALFKDTLNAVGGSEHPAKLGVLMAWKLVTTYGKKAYTMDATNVDEYIDCARITGIKGVYRKAQSHVLNHKAVAKAYAGKIGKKYEDCNFIVCHIDGGVTVSAHRKGLMVDGTEGAGGDGAFAPTRIGSIPILEAINYLKDHSLEELAKTCSRAGGFVSHFGTHDADKVYEMVKNNDHHAAIVWEAMNYQICKSVGAMSCVLKGKVDAIILTGGLVRFDSIVNYIKDCCSWIAPIVLYPGELEQETLANKALDAIEGRIPLNKYTGKPVFSGFDWDK